MNVGERIKYFREQRGITVNKLANLAGVSQSYLRDLELGNKQPTVEYLVYICDSLGVSLSSFFDDTKTTGELDNEIKMLTETQRQALLGFIKSMKK